MRKTVSTRTPAPCDVILEMFLDWLRADGDDLVSSAALLGGDAWEALACSVVCAVSQGASVDDVEMELRHLRGLLALEFVEDLSSEEARRFMAIHPDDPRADLARLCAEALEKGLDAFDQGMLARGPAGDVQEAA